MILKQNAEIKWLEFEHFQSEKRLKHYIFLRTGGVSLSSYKSLNLSFSVGDNSSHVSSNFEKIKQLFPSIPLVLGRYSHGNEVVEVTKNKYSFNKSYDGLLTEQPLLGLMTTHADCQAAIFYDPILHKLANVHAGWRGNVAKIYTKTIEYMRQRWGCRPENLLVGISPSLGPSHAEFLNYKIEFPSEAFQYVDQHSHINLWDMAEEELYSNGILPSHVEIARQCTFSDSDHFFSYRRDKICGRHVTLAYMENK